MDAVRKKGRVSLTAGPQWQRLSTSRQAARGTQEHDNRTFSCKLL